MSVNESKISSNRDDWEKKTINWELVRGFGQSPIASLSIVMPFIGYVLIYHSQISAYLGDLGGMLTEQELQFASPDETQKDFVILSMHEKLNLIYLGMFLVGVGSIIYRLFAPKTIKEFSSISSFSSLELPRATARRLRSMMTTISSRRPEITKDLFSIAPWLDKKHSNLKTASSELKKFSDEQIQNDVLSSFYNVESRYTSRVALYITLGFYSSGFLLLAVPGLTFTFRVLRIVFCNLVGGLIG